MSTRNSTKNEPKIGSIIAQHRRQREWTQFQLALESGVPVTAIRRLEQMDQIQLAHLLMIVSALGVRLEIAPLMAEDHGRARQSPLRIGRKQPEITVPDANQRKPIENQVSSTHRKHEARSLAMHRIIDGLLKRSPQKVIEHGLNNIARWRSNGVDCRDLRIWETLLKQNPEKLSKVLKGTDERSIRLRQSSPFPGLISEKQRRKIFEAHQ